MELMQVMYSILELYLIFSLTTSLCTIYMANKIHKLAGNRLNWFGKLTYYGMMEFMGFVLAPIFFIVFIFYQSMYVDTAVVSMQKLFKEMEDNS